MRDSPTRDPELIKRPPDGRALHFQPQWRKDSPIDWPQDHCVARRDFAKFLPGGVRPHCLERIGSEGIVFPPDMSRARVLQTATALMLGREGEAEAEFRHVVT